MLFSNIEFIVLKGFDPKKDGNCPSITTFVSSDQKNQNI